MIQSYLNTSNQNQTIAEHVYGSINMHDAEKINQFLKKNPTFDITLPMGEALDSPLRRATYFDDDKIVEALLKDGYIGNSEEVYECFGLANNREKYGALRSFIESNSINLNQNIPNRGESFGSFCLKNAVSKYCEMLQMGSISQFKKQHRDFILFLIKKTPESINHQDPDGKTALHTAAFFGEFPLMKDLVDHGGKTDIKDKYGVTPWQRFISLHLKNDKLIDYANTEKGTPQGLFEVLPGKIVEEVLLKLDKKSLFTLIEVNKFFKAFLLKGSNKLEKIELEKRQKPEGKKEYPIKGFWGTVADFFSI